MYIAILAVIVAAVAAFLLLLIGYRVIKAAHTRPAGTAAPGTHGGSPASGAHSHSRLERSVLTILTSLFRISLKLGVRLGPMMMLTVRGRKTGLPRTNPVDLFEQDSQYWLVATHEAGASWVRNLQAAGEGTLARGRRKITFTAGELPQDQAGVVLRDVIGPRLARPLGGLVLRQTIGLAPDAPTAEFIAAAASHPVFELTVSQDSRRARATRDRRARARLAGGLTLPRVAIITGLLVAAAHLALGAAGVMTAGQWISGVAIGLLIAGVGNHVRIFGRR